MEKKEEKKRIKIIRAVGGHKKKKRIIRAANKYLTKAAKVLIVSKPIAIFYAEHRKS